MNDIAMDGTGRDANALKSIHHTHRQVGRGEGKGWRRGKRV
jgi:hypothetical protein